MTNDQRKYLLADFFSVALIGGIAGVGTGASVDPQWNMLLAMAVGMVWGMVVQILTLTVLMPAFGAFEVMMPAMLSGMGSGMVVGMLAAMVALTPGAALLVGAGIGILLGVWAWHRNRSVAGIVK